MFSGTFLSLDILPPELWWKTLLFIVQYLTFWGGDFKRGWSWGTSTSPIYLFIYLFVYLFLGGVVASWLVRLTLKRAVRVRALAGNNVLCSWARHLTLTVPLSTQVYKWVPANCWGNLTNCGEVTCDGLASRPGQVEILRAASCDRNWDKPRQLWASLGSNKPRLHSLFHVDLDTNHRKI